MLNLFQHPISRVLNYSIAGLIEGMAATLLVATNQMGCRNIFGMTVILYHLLPAGGVIYSLNTLSKNPTVKPSTGSNQGLNNKNGCGV